MEFKLVLELTSFNTIFAHNKNYLMIEIKNWLKTSTFAEMYLRTKGRRSIRRDQKPMSCVLPFLLLTREIGKDLA